MCTRYAGPLASCLCTVTGSLSFRGIGHTEMFPNVSNCARIPRVVKINTVDPLPRYIPCLCCIYISFDASAVSILSKKISLTMGNDRFNRGTNELCIGARFTNPFRSARQIEEVQIELRKR